MARATVISDGGACDVDAAFRDGRVLVDDDALETVLGWRRKPEGLCRADVCVPVPARAELDHDGLVDIVVAAGVLQRPALVDSDARAVVLGAPAGARTRALTDLRLPELTLPDLDGNDHPLEEWRGRKRLLVAFASW
jgi:hypothetical protein